MSRIVILGAGESGAGAAVLAKKEGFDVFVSDMSKIADKYKKMLDDRHIEWEEGQHTEEKILNADEIIKSPGIPDTAPMIVKVKEKGIHIISEIEFAGRYTNSKMICITGSNGKTTTTSLIYHIFKEAGYDAGLAGNIGNSLALQVAEDPHEYYIIELSSFQLDNMYDFRANIAILLNITPDHLDRYDFKMQNYVDAKMRIIQNQTPQDAFIYWADDPIIKRELAKYDIKAIQYPFSDLKEKGVIGYIEEGQYKIEKPEPFNMEQESLSLTGRHNIYNSLAAGIASNVAGIKKEEIRKSLSDFPGIGDVRDRNMAETLRGTKLFVEHKALPKLKDNEYYVCDLIGSDVFEKNQKIGQVTDVLNYGASDILQIKCDDDELLLAMSPATILKVDLESRQIEVAIPQMVEGKDDES